MKINPIKQKTKIHAESMGLVDMANKVDELVKVFNKLLQAKEGMELSDMVDAAYKRAKKNPIEFVGENVAVAVKDRRPFKTEDQRAKEEASKGEDKDGRCLDCKCTQGYHRGWCQYNTTPNPIDPPQQEESKGEWKCKRCGEKNISYVCQNCAEESPKEDERLYKDGESGGFVEVTDKYVSKEKIKREIDNIHKLVGKYSDWKLGSDGGFYYISKIAPLEVLKKSLGLGD